MERGVAAVIAFGPIPSRRLGRSLGINHVPAKTCSYACVYCQVGRTTTKTIERQVFYRPEDIVEGVRQKIAAVEAAGDHIDYLSFVPDGEPTLDANLGRTIDLLRPLGYKIAVITNGSLVWRHEVREDLMGADWVSLKVDAVDRRTWQRVSRPHPHLDLESILEGMKTFSDAFEGFLATETMLVEGMNDKVDHLEAVADFLVSIGPDTAYLSIPTRPPAEERVRAPGEADVHRAYQIFSKRLGSVELLIGYEGDAFASSGDAEQDVLSITAVHPMREKAVLKLLDRAGADPSLVERMIAEGKLLRVTYEGDTFYMRRIASRE
jgi:wyosine [tRNA(Phe)-imidazoG37] synthetase (radical SAM superfamily)